MASVAIAAATVGGIVAYLRNVNKPGPTTDAPPSSSLATLSLVARAGAWSVSEGLTRWRLTDLTYGLATHARREGSMREEVLLTSAAEVGRSSDWLDTLILLQRLIAYSTQLARHRKEGDFRDMCAKMDVEESDILAYKLTSGVLRPAYLIIRDEELREIVVVVRGTYSMKDTVTCLMGAAQPHHMIRRKSDGEVEVVLGYAHGGMLTSARWLMEEMKETLEAAKAEKGDWGVRVVGHSLGGATAFLLTSILRSQPGFEDTVSVAYASPCVVTLELADAAKDWCITVMCGEDVVPMLCTYSLKSIRIDVLQSAWHEEYKRQYGGESRTYKALSAMSAASSAVATSIYRAASLTSSAVYSVGSVTASFGREVYRLPSKRLVFRKCSASERQKYIDEREADGTTDFYFGMPVSHEPATEPHSPNGREMDAPSVTPFDATYENEANGVPQETLAENLCDVFDDELGIKKMASGPLSTVITDALTNVDVTPHGDEPPMGACSDNESAGGEEGDVLSEARSDLSDAGPIATEIRQLKHALEKGGHRPMFPPGVILHMFPQHGPDAWVRPEKGVEPQFTLRRRQSISLEDHTGAADTVVEGTEEGCEEEASEEEASTLKKKASSGQNHAEGGKINTEAVTKEQIPWEIYAGVPNTLYCKIRLSKQMVRDHYQFIYDAALDQLVQQMIDAAEREGKLSENIYATA